VCDVTQNTHVFAVGEICWIDEAYLNNLKLSLCLGMNVLAR